MGADSRRIAAPVLDSKTLAICAHGFRATINNQRSRERSADNETMFAAFPFPRLPHHKPGTEFPGHIVPEEHNGRVTVLRCNECGDVVGQVESWPLRDLASLALTAGMYTFIPDPEHINALPEPVRRYVHDLATRVDPAGDTAQIALLKENNAALWKRVQELEGQIAQLRPKAADLAIELQRIYDSEINLRIDWLWDGGIRAVLGDEMNGFVAEENVDSVTGLVPWLQAAIAHFYPDCTYTASLHAARRDRGRRAGQRRANNGVHCYRRITSVNRDDAGKQEAAFI
jgi:hypothetical protein